MNTGASFGMRWLGAMGYLALSLSGLEARAADESTLAKVTTLESYLSELGYSSIPLFRDADLGLVKARGQVSGRSCVFFLSSGLPFSCVTPKIAGQFKSLSELDIHLKDPVLGTLTNSEIVLVDELRLGVARFPNQPMYRVRNLDPVLGNDFLIRHNCMVDITRGQLFARGNALGPEMAAALDETLAKTGYSVVTLKRGEQQVPVAKVEIDAGQFEFVVDFGVPFTTLSKLAADRKSRSGMPYYNYIPEFHGSIREGRYTMLSVKSLKVGGAAVPTFKSQIKIAEARKGATINQGFEELHVDGELGADILTLNRALLDVSRGKLWLAPLSTAKETKSK